MEINWTRIKEVWEEGAANLAEVAKEYKLTITDISIHAMSEGWPDRGSAKPLIKNFDCEILNDAQVSLAHKTDLGRLRLLAACVLESLQYEQDQAVVLKATERLAKIYAQIIPLERKVFGMELGSDGAPDGIIINVGGHKNGN